MHLKALFLNLFYMVIRYFVTIMVFAFFSGKAQLIVEAGNARTICKNSSIELGGNPTASGGASPYTYSWNPAVNLSDASDSNPLASPEFTTTYTVTVTSGALTKTDSVKITVANDTGFADAGPDVTIIEGQTITLHATGGLNYSWWPNTNMTYWNTADPDVEPTITITYFVFVTNENGCIATDDVKVTVEKSDSLFFYNTFTPNQDGENDRWYIGNVWKYPENKLQVFNRFGKLVYTASPYANEWDGKSFSDELPAATYYYVFTPGGDKKVITGAVTIVR